MKKPPDAAQGIGPVGFRTDINALRALAVTLVVLFHFHIRPFQGGFIGVDVFFVISGYLMTRIITSDLRNDRFRYLDFLASRVARIWPALLVLLLALLVLAAFLLAPLDYRNLARQSVSAALFYSNLHFAQGAGYFTTATDERWLLHTWSLSVEWQFYMLYPAILYAIDRSVRNRRSTPGAGDNARLLALGLLAAASLATSVLLTRGDQTQAFFSLFSRAWEMFAGGLALMLEPKAARLPSRSRLVIAMVGVACIVAAAALASHFDWEASWPGALALLPVVGTAVVLAVGSAPSIQSRWLIANQAVQKIGLWSYSIYLWHWPLAVALGFLTLDSNAKRVAKLGAIGLCLLLAFASYSLVETRVKLRRGGGFLQPVPIGSIALALLLAALSIAVVRTDGWIQRTGDDLAFYQRIERIVDDHSAQEPCDNYQKDRGHLATCSINPGAPGKRVLVYGDSHAGHLYPWFLKHATVGVDFFTSSGCPPVPGFNRRASGFHCPDYLEAALRRAEDDRYSTIVVSGNWGVGMDEKPSGLCRSVDGRCAPGDPPADRADLVEANVVAWRRLLDLGKTVVLVDQSPVAYFEILPTVMRRRFLGLAPPRDFDEMVPIDAGPVSYLDDVVARLPASPHLHRVSLRPEFCDRDRCRTMDDQLGIPILSDQSHFVPEWMEHHGDAFRAYAVAP